MGCCLVKEQGNILEREIITQSPSGIPTSAFENSEDSLEAHISDFPKIESSKNFKDLKEDPNEDFNKHITIKSDLNKENQTNFSELILNNQENAIIKFPRLEIDIQYQLDDLDSERVIITPNSINGVLKTNGEIFSFGRNTSQNPIISKSLLNKYPLLADKFNDINLQDKSLGPHQFDLSYVKEKGKFQVIDNKTGTGLFARMKKKVVIRNNMIIGFSNYHISLQLSSTSSDEKNPINNILTIQFFNGLQKNGKRILNAKNRKIFKIGRSKSADFVYSDCSVSRIQCSIEFIRDQWVLFDGDSDILKECSTNGLWLLANDKVDIFDNSILKTGYSTLFIKVVEDPSRLNQL